MKKNNNDIITRMGDSDTTSLNVHGVRGNTLYIVEHTSTIGGIKLSRGTLFTVTSIGEEVSKLEIAVLNQLDLDSAQVGKYIFTFDEFNITFYNVKHLTDGLTSVTLDALTPELVWEPGFIYYLKPKLMLNKINSTDKFIVRLLDKTLSIGCAFGEDMGYVYQKATNAKIKFNAQGLATGDTMYQDYIEQDTKMLVETLPGFARHYKKVIQRMNKSTDLKEQTEAIGIGLLEVSEGVLLGEASFDPVALVTYYQAVLGTIKFQRITAYRKGDIEGTVVSLHRAMPYKIAPINQIGYGYATNLYDADMKNEYGSKFLIKPETPIALP